MNQKGFNTVYLILGVVAFIGVAAFSFSVNQRASISPTPPPTIIQASSPSAIPSSVITSLPTAQPKISVTSAPTVSTSFGQRTKTSGCVSTNGLPDKGCTPGAIDPRVTQANIQQTICVSGYTTTVRPSSSYTTKLKIQQIQEYGFTDTNTGSYEEDHLIPLEVGGAPSDPANLWPEPGNIPNPKDSIENLCHKLVCNGQMLLIVAQQQIASDWHIACQGGVSTTSSQTNIVIPTTVPQQQITITSNLDCSTRTALCNDGTCSDVANHQGACSYHGGVSVFYK